jgi:hypothetical protein
VRQQIEMTGVRLQSARVTAWSGRQHIPTLAINRGERHGVLVGHVVASGFNLVGKVVDTAPLNATVQLITAPGRPLAGRFVAPAMDADAPPDASAGAELEPQTRGGRRVFEAVVPVSSLVEVGYLAHLSDESWAPEARGFVIGKVVKVEPYAEDPTLRKLVTVEPVESLPHVSQVVVLVPTAGE